MRKKLTILLAVAMTALLAATAAFAAVTFDPATGEGFVGKGDVQTALGFNNKQLQDNVNNIQFRTLKVTETTWTCDRDAGPQTQERERTTTTQGVVDMVARERNQITGFNLTGYSGPEEEIANEGPPVGSCPTGWTAINQSSQVISSTLQVSADGTNFVSLS
jgi:opacity protein-like surface antigen